MAENYLQRYTRQNLWCSPQQDKQAIFEPARVSIAPGDLVYFYLNEKKYDLPDAVNRYFVYMIGKLHFDILGIEYNPTNWSKLSDVCNSLQMLMHVYTTKGVSIPLHRCYYRYNRDGNLLFAIPSLSQLNIDLQTESIYIKFYTNAYFFTDESTLIDDHILVIGKTSGDINDIVDFQNQTEQFRTTTLGKAIFYVNGYRVNRVYPGNTKAGDLIEMVYDGTIREEFTLPVLNLPYFESQLDNERKYLILNPSIRDQIDFYDDLEFYISTSSDLKKSVYYHKNMPSSVRMVTHQDYSVRVDSVVALATALGLENPENAFINVVVRKGGYVRPLITNAHRTHELFKLPLNQRTAAMVGIDSTVDAWRATNLEASAYTELMGALKTPFDQIKVDEALGYNAISNVIGKSPLTPIFQSGIKSVHLPYGLVDRATLYHYDSNGKLISHAVHHGVGEDAVVPINCELIEAFSGIADTMFDDQTTQTFTLNPLNEYRFYKAKKVADISKYIWEDVTGSNDYTITGQNGLWNISLAQYVVIVRSDAKFVHRDIDHVTLMGTIEILLNEIEGNLQTLMQVPPGTVDIFLNDYVLTKGIDYFYTFPRITIVNKKYLKNPGTAIQKVTMRCMAFPRPDLSTEDLEDSGFIIAGKLSANSRYDLRDDKVQQIVIGGCVHFVNEIPFAEESEYSPYLDSMNGTPYHVKDMIVPTRGMTTISTVALREKSLIVDKQISDYLSIKLPEVTDNDFFTIPDKYPVISPFFARMTAIVRAKVIPIEDLRGHLTDDRVIALCQPYIEFLEHDPTQSGNEIDDRFVKVIPHMYDYIVDLKPEQYRFLSMINRLICNGKLDMSHFYTISS